MPADNILSRYTGAHAPHRRRWLVAACVGGAAFVVVTAVAMVTWWLSPSPLGLADLIPDEEVRREKLEPRWLHTVRALLAWLRGLVGL